MPGDPFSLFHVQSGLFPSGNRRATVSGPKAARSESTVAINPQNPLNMIGCSKKFIDPATYEFRLGAIYTFDGGETWAESALPMRPGWDVMTDPAMAFDEFGHAFLIAEPDRFNRDKIGTSEDITGLGMVVYRSTNGGASWEEPVQLTTDTRDDKQTVVCDNDSRSPHYGNVYVCWGAVSPLRFARSTDHGATWRGKGNDAPGTSLVSYSFAPEMSVSPDGTLHILWHNDGSSEISYIRSTDGGATFSQPQVVVTGVQSLRGHLPISGDWPHFDNGKFRVITLVTDCAGENGALVVAWADMREGRSRIYYRRSVNNGVSWTGPASGQPLLPNVNFGDTHCFHPQIANTRTGVIGCAYYTFGLEFGRHLIRVQLAASWDDGATFSNFITVTERSWDPLVGAPAVHGDPNVHFIGEYFGLDADVDQFALLWTDTRTGQQELFSDVVDTRRVKGPREMPGIVAQILAGVTQDGGGLIIVGGKIVRVPPRSPILEALTALAAAETAAGMTGEEAASVQRAALKAAGKLIDRQIKATRA